MTPNPYLLAADNPAALLTLLRDQPSLAPCQDEHGYSLIHAAASYNHLDLLRALVRDFKVPVDLRDEDGETALFVVETVDAARVLVEELELDKTIRNAEGQTAREKLEAEADWPAVAEYLKKLEDGGAEASSVAAAGSNGTNGAQQQDSELPPPPEGLQVTVGTMNETEAEELPVDPEFRRRIEELASREDFQTPEGQAELRKLIEEALGGGFTSERSVRPRQE
ncbi:hypothetical protein VTJ83DRAFT_4354 [Remersonia thermophila]|uniref:Ankyrin repeat protein n=1 Tax=Remersonia thermophila TaxID=72144 RepID=A0ABR4DBW2_9PEZI